MGIFDLDGLINGGIRPGGGVHVQCAKCGTERNFASKTADFKWRDSHYRKTGHNEFLVNRY